jgi:probable HAF family extracellular repeat protein
MKSRSLTCIIPMLAALGTQVCLAAQDGLGDEHHLRHHRYRLIDLGTFGGPASYFANGLDGILNNRGGAAGWANTSTPDPYPAFCFNPQNCFVTHAFEWKGYALTDLGTLPRGKSSQAVWISSNGLIAGTSQNGRIDPLIPGLPENRAVLWKDGQIIDLGTLQGGHESIGMSVNNHGQVVGAFNNTIPDPFSLVGNGYQVRAFVWQDGSMQDLGTLGGPDAWAFIVNQKGQITGQSYITSTPNSAADACGVNVPTVEPFLWDNGLMVPLGTLGGTCGFPTGMNDRGQVTGQSDLAGDLTFHPFLWDDGVLTDLRTLGGDTGTTQWINNAGDVVGKADLPDSFSPPNHDAVLWSHGEIKDLGTLPGDSCSNAYYVNSRGQVVGTSEDRQGCIALVGQHAFLWEHGGPMVDLNTLIPRGHSLQLTYAVAINERGEIAGFGVPRGVAPDKYETEGHAYVLIPCDRDDSGEEGCEEDRESSFEGQGGISEASKPTLSESVYKPRKPPRQQMRSRLSSSSSEAPKN